MPLPSIILPSPVIRHSFAILAGNSAEISICNRLQKSYNRGMTERFDGATELMTAASDVGDHLLDEIERNNPAFRDERTRFDTAAMVAGFNGSDRAFALGWSTLANGTAVQQGHNIKGFAEAAIKYHGVDGPREALTMTDHLSDYSQAFDKASILTEVAEAAADDNTRQQATVAALDLLADKVPQQLGEQSFDQPSDLLVRLGIANGRPDLIEQAAADLAANAPRWAFMRAVAKALSKEQPEAVRTSLVEAAINVHSQGLTYPATMLRDDLPKHLKPAEIRSLLAAIHRDGKQPILSRIDSSMGTHTVGVGTSNDTEMTAFNRLTSEHDAWAGPWEHARFAIGALRARIVDRRQQRRTFSPDMGYAAHTALRIMAQMDSDPGLQNPLVLDDKLTNIFSMTYREDKDDIKALGRNLSFLWSLNLTSELRDLDFSKAAKKNVAILYELRDRLPKMSAARLEINAAFGAAGDTDALFDSARALVSESHGLVMSLPHRKDTDIPQLPRLNLYPYKFNFFYNVAEAVHS